MTANLVLKSESRACDHVLYKYVFIFCSSCVINFKIGGLCHCENVVILLQLDNVMDYMSLPQIYMETAGCIVCVCGS